MTEILSIKLSSNRREIPLNKNVYDENDDINLITLICENDQKFELKAETECCDWSYFKFENMQSIIGQKIIGINNGENHIRSCEDKKRPEKSRYIKTYHHILHFENDQTFLLQLINKSNGYYHGTLKISGKSNTLINYKPNSIIIIVGIPGAGKTSYGNSIKKEGDRIFDDVTCFLIINEDFASRRNIFISSLYCDEDTYENLIKSLYIANPKEAVQTICFDINTEQSIENVKRRENYIIKDDKDEIVEDKIVVDDNNEDDEQYAKNMMKVMKNEEKKKEINKEKFLEVKEENVKIKIKINSLIKDIDRYSGYNGYDPKYECYINSTIIPTYKYEVTGKVATKKI